MTVRDFVMVAIGEIILLGTFALGMGVGMSLMRKELQDASDEDQEGN